MTTAEEISYLQKTDDAYLYDNLSLSDFPYRDMESLDSGSLDSGSLDHNSILEKANKCLVKDGVVSIKNIMNLDELEEIRKYARRVMYNGDAVDTLIKDKHKHIIFAKGRQDMWHIDLPLTIPQIIKDIIRINMRCEYKQSSTGVLTLDKNTNHTGKWHRDVLSLFTKGSHLDNDIFTRDLPDFYFTVFIPLTTSVKENGATQILLGSHNSDNNSLSVIEGYAGDAVVMNGKTIHRSVPNMSDIDRDVLYVIYCAKWYDEEKY